MSTNIITTATCVHVSREHEDRDNFIFTLTDENSDVYQTKFRGEFWDDGAKAFVANPEKLAEAQGVLLESLNNADSKQTLDVDNLMEDAVGKKFEINYLEGKPLEASFSEIKSNGFIQFTKLDDDKVVRKIKKASIGKVYPLLPFSEFLGYRFNAGISVEVEDGTKYNVRLTRLVKESSDGGDIKKYDLKYINNSISEMQENDAIDEEVTSKLLESSRKAVIDSLYNGLGVDVEDKELEGQANVTLEILGEGKFTYAQGIIVSD